MTVVTGRRLVVFVGPHKSASSSVQELFMKTAASNLQHEKRHPSLVNWTWPWNPRRRSYLPRKGFAPLVTEGEGFVKLIHETILNAWNESARWNGHLILGTEELDRFGATPWSHRDGVRAIERIRDLIQPDYMEIVLNYRRPRQDQWISVWKQLTRSKPREYAQFLCDPQEQLRVWEYLDCVANPLGLAHALLEKGWEVRLMDMAGIASKGRDVGHVVACDVLGVSCDDHWLPGLDHPILQNKKTGDPGLSPQQLDAMEGALRLRDCGYKKSLTDHPRLHIFEGETMWKNCVEATDASVSKLGNTTLLLNLLQRQVGCGPIGGNAGIATDRKDMPTVDTSSLHQSSARTPRDAVLSSQQSETKSQEDAFLMIAQLQLMVMYAMLVMTILVILRKVKCKKFPRTQKLAGHHILEHRQLRPETG